MDKLSPCPRCGSNNVKKESKWMMVLGLLGCSLCFIWLSMFFPSLWPMVPISIVAAVVMMFIRKTSWHCQDCNHLWVVKKSKDIPQ
ncbi:hypothetical protein V6C27_10010 [Peptococcaceae bacterium 1198_IL3148]